MVLMKVSSHRRGRRALSGLLVLCLGYGVAMVVMTTLLADQHAEARFAVGAAAIAPLTAVATLYAALRSHHAVTGPPRHHRLLFAALFAGAILGAGIASLAVLVR